MTAIATVQEPPAPIPAAPAGTSVVLQARDVVKELGHGAGKVRALKGVSLSLNTGELTLLMGPSGSGKTTLLSILGCILTPTAGTLTVAGRSATGLAPETLARLRRQHVGFIFQSYNLFPTLTAEENVRLALDVRGERGSDAVVQAQRALHQVGLRHKLKSYPANLSGGEQQRVAVARALARDPEVLFLDEPTASLDPFATKLVEDIIMRTVEGGVKVVMATHDLGQARRLAGDIAFLANGSLVEHTTAAAFFDTPATSEARRFLAGELVI